MMAYFFTGTIFFGFLVIAGFFFKFWVRSRDHFFLLFAIAFLLFGIERFCVSLFVGRTTISYIYIIRLIACCLILAAIVQKNRK
ncbi:MAG TPA: DUF5985 family protein [Candidatus Angelobacter sp.]|nr:DUF5985 family protein [Candidatus Angelobacter sp.]